MKQHTAHLGEHLRRRLFFYASGAIAFGWVLGANLTEVASAHQRELGWVMNVLVFLMIYPMMIGLNLEQLPKAMARPRPLLLSLLYNFVITPLLSYALVRAMSAPPELALGFYLVMLIPGSSMAIAYTGMAGGSIEVATLAQAAGFLVVPFALPFFMHWAGQSQAVVVPLGSLATTVMLVLILPMALGDLTRRFMVRRFGPQSPMATKPFLGVIPALTMLVLMALIFFSKGAMLAQNWRMLLPLMAATLAFLVIILAIMTWLNRRGPVLRRPHGGGVCLKRQKQRYRHCHRYINRRLWPTGGGANCHPAYVSSRVASGVCASGSSFAPLFRRRSRFPLLSMLCSLLRTRP